VEPSDVSKIRKAFVIPDSDLTLKAHVITKRLTFGGGLNLDCYLLLDDTTYIVICIDLDPSAEDLPGKFSRNGTVF
jgi:hypothetical protein